MSSMHRTMISSVLAMLAFWPLQACAQEDGSEWDRARAATRSPPQPMKNTSSRFPAPSGGQSRAGGSGQAPLRVLRLGRVKAHETFLTPISAQTDARHAVKMAKKKAARDKIMAGKAGDHGLIIVHTGTGKGKSSSGFGMILRCVAHQMPCAVVQFIKGGMSTGERDLILRSFTEICEFHTMGEGFTWETQDKSRDTEMAQAAWAKAKELIRDPANRMVLLDEINIAIRYDYVDIADVVTFLTEEKPPMTHVILTGRNAHDDLIEIADLVTEMELIKHPFRSGIKAQIGVEF